MIQIVKIGYLGYTFSLMKTLPVSEVKKSSSPMPSATAVRVPQGLGAVQDRLERAHLKDEMPPSQFKRFLFDPMVVCIRWFLRGFFIVVEAIWDFAFDKEEPPAAAPPSLEPISEEQKLLERLRAAPDPEELFLQFERWVDEIEKNEIYLFLGAAHLEKCSWKEYLWKRTAEENCALGKELARAHPEKIKRYLEAALAKRR